MKKACFFSFFLWSLLVSCSPPKTTILFPLTQKSDPPLRDRYAVLLIADGGRLQEINALVKAGKLPTIKRLFYDNGAIFTHATTTYPTLSMPGHQAILTGVYPGDNGIPDLTWLDRENEEVVDYLSLAGHKRVNSDLINRHAVDAEGENFSDTPHTLFNALKGEAGFSSYELFFDGATQVHPRMVLMPGWRSIVEGRPEHLDLDALAATLHHWQTSPVFPRMTAISCYGIDDLSHEVTPAGERVVALYQGLDAGLAALETAAKNRGVLDRMTWVITADHGQHVTEGKELKLPQWLDTLGFRADDSMRTQRQNIHISARNVGDAQIYIKVAKSWKERPSFSQLMHLKNPRSKSVSLIACLRREPGVGFLVVRKNFETIQIMDREGEADIQFMNYGKTRLLSYTPLATPSRAAHDPLAYATEPSMQGTWTPGVFYDSHYWEEKSKDARHPDALQALAQLYDSPDAPDILLITDPAYSVRDAKLSNHGSIEKEDLQVPLLLSGPDIRKGTYDLARTVDIYPTLLAIFGVKEDPSLYDGEPALDILSPELDTSIPLLPTSPAPLLQDLAQLEAYFIDHPDYARLIDKIGFDRDLKKNLSLEKKSRTVEETIKVQEKELNEGTKRLDALRIRLEKTPVKARMARMKRQRLLALIAWEKEKRQARMLRFDAIHAYLQDARGL